MKYRVYDDRSTAILFESDDKSECYLYILENYSEGDDDWEHIFIDTTK